MIYEQLEHAPSSFQSVSRLSRSSNNLIVFCLQNYIRIYMQLSIVVDCKIQKLTDFCGSLCGRYMDKIIEYVQVILANKYAYVANGSVYFDTKAFKY